MPSAKSILFFFSLAIQCVDLVPALPMSGRATGIAARKGKQTQQAATGPKISTAKDGSTIIDDSVVINGLNMRFKISAPASELVSANGTAAAGTLGLNVLFHGDGGQSFFDFPNQGVNSNLMGVALLSPDADLRWGGSDPKDNTGLVRPDGPAHSAAVNQLLTKVLPTMVKFDPANIFLEGVSGGSLLLSGFMIPTFAASLGVPGAVLGCGGLVPQVPVQGDISGLRLHFQSTTDDLAALQTSIPQAITAYEKIITDTTLLTADASPTGGHCEFDQKDFVSGVQLLSDNFAPILLGTGQLNGVSVANSVVGKEDLFANGGAAKTTAGKAATTGKATATTGSTKNVVITFGRD
ncbi:hypothetical protein B0H17DRAFT_1131486 [Mycena rosella]|uniref:Cyclin-like f-box protein n=1 Tax=Mycena rosella TaxID=1033263 RepID=A0AAD7DNK0_MYCRO|nr:hypothetical protein B0H17DRAFT_1131486 [Mycena rosella]